MPFRRSGTLLFLNSAHQVFDKSTKRRFTFCQTAFHVLPNGVSRFTKRRFTFCQTAFHVLPNGVSRLGASQNALINQLLFAVA
jgi:hypothetical protein